MEANPIQKGMSLANPHGNFFFNLLLHFIFHLFFKLANLASLQRSTKVVIFCTYFYF